jgi:3-oxoacyl-[acyl-carrier protein] reductase
MELGLKDKVALVTGGSRGIGTAICRALGAEGMKVGVNYRKSKDEAEALAAEVNTDAFAGEAVALAGDMATEADIPKLFDQMEKAFGPVDVLVNNAAYLASGPIQKYTWDEWEHTFRVNVTGAFRASQEFIVRLRARSAKGRIVNIASQAAFLGSTSGHLPYDASKGGLVSMTRAIAREVAEEGINVNAIAPGMVMTEMVAAIWEQKKDKYLAKIPLKRIAQPEEIANIVVFLASDASSYLTGTTIDATGGLMMR